jgi:hypothetical protein
MPWNWFAAYLDCSWPQILDKFQKTSGVFFDTAPALQDFKRTYRDSIDSLTEIEIVAEVARRHLRKVPMAVASAGTPEIVEVRLMP